VTTQSLRSVPPTWYRCRSTLPERKFTRLQLRQETPEKALAGLRAIL
jgi:hypothetical protein